MHRMRTCASTARRLRPAAHRLAVEVAPTGPRSAAPGGSSTAPTTSSAAPVSSAPADEKVTLTWWHNATAGPAQELLGRRWRTQYHGSPPERHVQDRAGPERDDPDQDPGGAAVEQPAGHLPAVGRRRPRHPGESGKVKDITAASGDTDQGARRPAPGWHGRRQAVRRCRTACGVVGFWYRKDLFTKAGISAPPTTMAELDAAVAKLKATGIAPDRGRRQGQVAGRVLLGLLRRA